MLKIIKNNKEEILVVLVFMFFALGFNIYRVQSDGVYYYSFLESILHIPNPESSPAALQHPCFRQAGCVYFNAPFYLLAYTIENLFKIKLDFNGITLRQISINLSSNFYMILSLILVIKILKRLNFKHIIISTFGVLFSTTAFAAAVIVPSFNHAIDIFITTLFIFLLLKNRETYSARPFLLGVLVVIAILVRYLNFVLIILGVLYYLNLKEYRKIMHFLLGFLAVVWIVPLILYVYNGTISPFYETNFTIGKVAKEVLLPHNFLKFLVHPLHGLFIWSPVTILSALGLLYFPGEKVKLGYLLLAIGSIYILIHGFASEWHAGWSFSNRYLVSMFPIYILGLSAFLEKYGKKAIPLVVIMTVYSIILFLNWHLCIFHAEFETPQDIIKIWIKGESGTFMDGKVNLNTFLHRLWEWCRYKYIFKALM